MIRFYDTLKVYGNIMQWRIQDGAFGANSPLLLHCPFLLGRIASYSYHFDNAS